MIEAQDHKNEQVGLTVLYGMKMNAARCGIDDSIKSINVPIAYVSTIDEESQNIHSSCGLNFSKSERWSSFCGHTINLDKPLIVEKPCEHENSRILIVVKKLYEGESKQGYLSRISGVT